MPSIDKCAGDGCICKTLNKRKVRRIQPRIITDMKVQSVSIDHGPSIFPGAGGMSIQMITTSRPTREEITARVHREQQIYMEAKYGRR